MPFIREVGTREAPAAIGPYAQAVVCEGWIYVSGQIPVEPSTGELIRGDITSQTNQVFRNLRAILEAAGGSLTTVVKTTVYISDMDDFGEMNDAYAHHFPDHKPARATIQAARLPRDVGVEIEVIAREID